MKEYEIQTKRKENGLPFKNIPKTQVNLAVKYKKYLVSLATLCVIIVSLLIILPLKQFEINTTKLMSLGEGTFARSDFEQVLGEPTVIEGDKWIYYDRNVSKIYERLEEIDSELKLLSSQNMQDTDEYKVLKKEEDDLYTELLTIDSWYRIEVLVASGKAELIDYRRATLEEELFGYDKRQKDFYLKFFSFELEYEVGSECSWDNCQVKTRYTDGSFTLVTIPKTAFGVVDVENAGVYKVSWNDPITGMQTVDITVK